jgi:hypothetical protein
LRLHWWGDALRRVLMFSGGMEMYGVPGRSVLRKKDARVRIPSLASLMSFIVKVFFKLDDIQLCNRLKDLNRSL